MDGGRGQRWGNNGRWQNRKPPRGSSNLQPAMPTWEKEFCRAVGSFDWETFLQIKSYAHIYDNVMNWNDSAVEEAFINAKKRYWAQINGIPCDIPLPDPNLDIQEIDWDNTSYIDPDFLQDFENEAPVEPSTEENHDPIIIFCDSLIAGQSFSATGWGDEEENFQVPPPTNDIPANNDGVPLDQGWGDSVNYYPNGARQFGDGGGRRTQGGNYVSWGGGDWNNNNNWGWNSAVRPDNGAGGQVSNYGTSGARGSDEYRSRNNYGSRNDNGGSRYRGSYRGKHSAANRNTVPREWNRERRVS